MHPLKKFFYCLALGALMTACYQNSFAQEGKPSFFDRLFFGGGLGLQFGDVTVVNVAPIVGYKVTERFAVGVGATYIYLHYRDRFYDYKTNIYGGSVFTKYFLYESLFAYAEYGILNMDVPAPFVYNGYVRDNIQSFLVGGGYRQLLSDNVGIELMILYDLIDEPYSPYVNPVVRLGIVAGF